MKVTKELLDEINAQERDLAFENFSHEDAWHIGSLLHDRAVREGKPIAIDIRMSGQILFHSSLKGSSPDNDEWIRRKSAVVARFHHSSFGIGVALALDGKTIEEKHCVSSFEFSAHGGSFPITLRGSGIVGSITVSGLPQEDDHAMVVAAIKEHLGKR
jgi:uncharacterized protein (UPF0303 family)